MSTPRVTPLGDPTDHLDGDEVLGAPRWAQIVTMLWAISRSRGPSSDLAAYSTGARELQDMFETYRPDAELPDTRAVWASMGRSLWWSTDLYPDATGSLAAVEAYDTEGGLSRRAAALVSADADCAEAVYALVKELEWTPTVEELLDVLAFSDFVTFTSEKEKTVATEWPGVLDVESAWGSQDLADAAGHGDWDTVLELIDASIAAGRNLVNTWRPGGISWSAPMHQAARQGAPTEVVRQLLNRGAWLFLVDANGDSPLDLAVIHGHCHLYEILDSPSTTRWERAVFNSLESHFVEGIGQLLAGEQLPRMRPPVLEVLEESGGVLTFSPGPQWPDIQIWVNENKLYLLQDDAESPGGADLRVCSVEGEWSSEAWEGSGVEDPEQPYELAPEEGDRLAPGDRDDDGQGSDAPEADATETGAPIYGGVRIITGTSKSSGLVYVICPRDKFEKLLRMPALQGSSIGIVLTRRGRRCRWHVLGRRWRQHIPALRDDAIEEGWTDLVLFSSVFRRKAMNEQLEGLIQLEASTGKSPDENTETKERLVDEVGVTDASVLMRRWALLSRSMAKHGLSPTHFPDSEEVEDVSLVQGFLGRGDRPDTSVGHHKEFPEPLVMMLQTTTLSATGQWDGSTMVVKAGSQAARSHSSKQQEYYIDLRKKLVRAGKLVSSGSTLIFTQDHRFDSPTAAANIIVGSSVNGRKIWRDGDGRNINDHEGGAKWRKATS